MLKTKTSEILGKAKGGVFAGLVGGIALFSSFIGIDSHLEVEFGTFYKLIGVPIGLDGVDAIAFGFFAHILTAALIGSVFYAISSLHRSLNIVTIQKGVLAGGITGLVVFALFFMPIHILIMVPSVESEISQSISSELGTDIETLRKLLASTDDILWGAMLLHVLYGVVMGFFCGIMANEEYTKIVRYKKFL